MKESITSAVIGALVLGAMFWGGLLILTPHGSQPLGGSIDVPGYSAVGTAGTSSSATVTTSSTQVVATSTGRSYLVLSNTSGAVVFCNMDNGKPAVVGSGVAIATSSQFVMSLNNDALYRGTVNCISAANSSVVAAYAH